MTPAERLMADIERQLETDEQVRRDAQRLLDEVTVRLRATLALTLVECLVLATIVVVVYGFVR